jgi:hypothetical protein
VSPITIRVTAKLSADVPPNAAPTAPTDDQLRASVEQCVADAVEGTFGELARDTSMRAQLHGEPRLGQSQDGRREIEFAFDLPDAMFPVRSGGIQHLVGVLASDAFPDRAAGCVWTEVRVAEISSPLTAQAREAFGARGNDIATVRLRFALQAGEPLVAFSFKPRVGFTHDHAKALTREVVAAGVHLVEFDTRNLEDPEVAYPRWQELAEIASAAGPKHRSGVYAPNLSHASAVAAELATRWCQDTAVPGQRVIKVDGGLDGLSTLQAIRTATIDQQPITTTYPLLRRALAPFLGSSNTWVDLLAASGADVIYPGNRPDFSDYADEARKVGGDEAQGLRGAQERYRSFTVQGWPMPTFAAGAHPGHLQVVYELVGPDVAYFLGGAIALHPDGPAAGARLCVRILEQACQLADEARRKGRPFSDDLHVKLIAEIESYPVNGLCYHPPSTVFDGTGIHPFYLLNQ